MPWKECARFGRPRWSRTGRFVAICVFVVVQTSQLRPAVAGPVAFTEIMYNPSGDDGFFRRGRNTEWLEVANVSDHAVRLLDWQLRKATRRRVRTLGAIREDRFLLPGQLAILVPGRSRIGPDDYRRAWSIDSAIPIIPISGWGDTSSFGLSNSSGEIQLVDAAGNLADAVRYGLGSRLPPAENGTSLEITIALSADLARLNDQGDVWRLARQPIPHPGIYSGVRFGTRDRGTPGSLAAGAVPAPASLWLLLAGAAVAVGGRRGRCSRFTASPRAAHSTRRYPR